MTERAREGVLLCCAADGVVCRSGTFSVIRLVCVRVRERVRVHFGVQQCGESMKVVALFRRDAFSVVRMVCVCVCEREKMH